MAKQVAVSVLAKKFPKFDTNLLLMKAAYYVNAGGSHARNASNFVLNLFGSPVNAPLIAEMFISNIKGITPSNTEFAKKLAVLLSRAEPKAEDLIRRLATIFAA